MGYWNVRVYCVILIYNAVVVTSLHECSNQKVCRCVCDVCGLYGAPFSVCSAHHQRLDMLANLFDDVSICCFLLRALMVVALMMHAAYPRYFSYYYKQKKLVSPIP